MSGRDEKGCEHVHLGWVMVVPPRPREYSDPVEVACPCCGLRAWNDGPEIDPDEEPCPYCGVQPVAVAHA